MTKLKMSRSGVRIVAAVVGMVWLLATIILAVLVLESVLLTDIRAYALVYPFVLLASVILGFIGSSLLARVLASLVIARDAGLVQPVFFTESPCVFPARQTVIVGVATVVLVSTMSGLGSTRGTTTTVRMGLDVSSPTKLETAILELAP